MNLKSMKTFFRFFISTVFLMSTLPLSLKNHKDGRAGAQREEREPFSKLQFKQWLIKMIILLKGV